MNTTNNHKIAQQIIDAYTKNLKILPQNSRGHFFQRAYRITGDQKYCDLLGQYYYNNRIPVIQSGLLNLRANVEDAAQLPLTGIHPKDNPRKIVRYELYKQEPALSFFDEFLINLYYIKSAHLCETPHKDLCIDAIDLLEKINFEKLYYNENTILKDGSFMINSVFFLNYLKISHCEKLHLKTVKFVKNYYLNNQLKLQKNLNQWEYHSFIYNLTHIIIAESYFYERSVDQHLWITQFFTENIEEIINRTKMDIISEIGLCIKLTKQQQKYSATMEIIQNHIVDNYDFDQMLSSDFLVKKEHNNSIIMLLFHESKEWFPGPNLSNEINLLNTSTNQKEI